MRLPALLLPLLVAASLTPWVAGCSDGDLGGLVPFEEEYEGWLIRGTRLKNGLRHGRTFATDPAGRLRLMETFDTGYIHGPRIRLYPNGQIVEEVHYQLNRKHGRYRTFTEDGQLIELGWIYRSRRGDTWCVWNEDGTLDGIVEYHEGKIVRDEDKPRRSCPLTRGAGRKHFDPHNRDYWFPTRDPYQPARYRMPMR